MDRAPFLPGMRDVAVLLDLARRARAAGSAAELAFLLANDTMALAPYRQAGLWLAGKGVHTLSGVVQAEANVPYAQWLDDVCRHLAAGPAPTVEPAAPAHRLFTALDLPAGLAAHWADWWPAHALWLALDGQGGAVFVRDEAWTEREALAMREWADTWWHAFDAARRPRAKGWTGARGRLAALARRDTARPWWRQKPVLATAAVLALLALPVRLTVLAPGELVPANPVVMRAPLDGVIDVFHVQPNQPVRKGEPLFGFDEALIRSKLEVAQQALATAETDYRQTLQLALSDARAKAQLAQLTGQVEEKRAEAAFLAGQLERARVLAPQDGVVLMDDPSEWIGKPVSVGERILRIAATGDTEVEAWLPLADAIALPAGAPVSLYLNASPLSPVAARLRYMAHDAVQRPDGQHAYRVRATLEAPTAHRVGLHGTAKVHGGWVPLGYWMLRRPLATLRAWAGV